MLELLRVPPMCVADWLNEWFESDLLKAALALPAVAGNFAGPWSPGTAANLLFQEAAAGPGVEGNAAALVAALRGACDAHGVEIRTRARVQRVVLDARRVRGVVLDSGEELQAGVVAASCDPKTLFLKLVPPGSCSARLLHRITHYRCTGTTAQVLFGLDRPPRAGDATFEFARTGAHVDEIERAFDAIKYKRFAAQPVLDIHVTSDAKPVASVLVHFAPYDLEGGWTPDAKEKLADTVTQSLSAHLDGFASSVVARHVLAPPDIEREYGVHGGDIHHGEHAIDQRLMRPAPECVDYATPIAGLFLCGSGSHPGGGLTCAPAWLATRAILERT
jgi:phytoene dehydrogenase-like protein